MTDNKILRSDFYVYALFREDGITPFYIGKGCGNRFAIHERDAYRNTSHKDRIIQNMHAAGIAEIPKAKLIEGLTDVEAKQIEVDLIHLLLRWPIGPLANLTNGGDGVANLSDESREKKSAANRRSWKDPEVHKKRSEGMKAVWTPEKRAAHRAVTFAAVSRPGVREIQSRRRREVAQDPEVKARVLAGAGRGAALKRDAMKALWADPETRARRCEASRLSQSTPEYRAKRSEIAKAMWARRKGQYAVPSAKPAESQP